MDSINKLAFIISKIEEYQNPGKKALQKLVYLIERQGVNLGYDFSIHYYGPYSSELDYAIYSLQMQGFIDIVQKGMTHRINTTKLFEIEEDNYIPDDDMKIIEEVLDTFGSMSAFELELITTTDFVAREIHRNGEVCSNGRIVEGVKRIKGDKFTTEKINQAIIQLSESGYKWN